MPKSGKLKRSYDLTKPFIVKENVYSNVSADALVLWTDMTKTAPTGKSSKSSSYTFTYAGSPAIRKVKLGVKTYNAAHCNDNVHANIQVADTTGILWFTTCADGGTPTVANDLPFTISMWVHRDSAASTSDYFWGRTNASNGYIRAYIEATHGKIIFELSSDNTPNKISIQTNDALFPDGATNTSWKHVVFTYDGSATVAGMKIYIDSELYVGGFSDDSSGTYIGIRPTFSQPFHVGANQVGADEFDGQISEFIAWNAALDAESIKAVYHATRQNSSEVISGYLNNPPRVLLRDRDMHTGSYPSILRTADTSFMGNSKSQFDDTKTVVFNSPYAEAKVRFKTLLAPGTHDSPGTKNIIVPINGFIIAFTGTCAPGGIPPSASFEFKDNENAPKKDPYSNIVNLVGTEYEAGKIVAQFVSAFKKTNLNIEVAGYGNTLRFRQHRPNTGSYTAQKDFLIYTATRVDSSFDTPQWPVVIDQFKLPAAGKRAVDIQLNTHLPTASIHLKSRIATPNALDETLKAPGVVRKGISDVGITFTPGENLTPFDDSLAHSVNDIPFYRSGTNENIMPGFGARLASKARFTVSIDPVTKTSVYFSTGSNPGCVVGGGSPGAEWPWFPTTTPTGRGPSGPNTGMVYYNFDLKRWEVIGYGRNSVAPTSNRPSGSEFDVLHTWSHTRASGVLAFVPTAKPLLGQHNAIPVASASLREMMGSSVGDPTDSYGFPYRSRYDATGSQLLKMSDYITEPFLLEKVVIEFSASFGPTVQRRDKWTGPRCMHFFLLNQRHMSASLERKTVEVPCGPGIYWSQWKTNQDSSGGGPPKPALTRNYEMGLQKDLVAVGVIAEVRQGVSPTWDYRDLNLDRSGSDENWPGSAQVYFSCKAITGSYSLAFTPKQYAKNDVVGIHEFCTVRNPSSTGVYNPLYPSRGFTYGNYEGLKNTSGFRDMVNISSGRTPSSTALAAEAVLNTQGQPALEGMGDPMALTGSNYVKVKTPLLQGTTLRRDAPYLLMPEDKLVVGFVNTPQFAIARNASALGYYAPYARSPEEAIRRMSVELSPGLGKIHFYGSTIAEGKPKSPQLNQPLTSLAIHEDLHESYHDQFDVEPYLALTGTYVDNIVNHPLKKRGKPVNTTLELSNDPSGASQVIASVAGGQAGTTGSLQRNVRVMSTNETYYDSTAPTFLSYHMYFKKQNGVGFNMTAHEKINFLASVGKGSSDAQRLWPHSFPFDGKFGEIIKKGRQQDLTNFFKDPITGETYEATEGDSPVNVLIHASPDDISGRTATYTNFDLELANLSNIQLYKMFFGIGDYSVSNLPFPKLPGNWAAITTENPSPVIIRGWKYGLISGVPQSTGCVFRRDRFGQFRDLLEGRLYTRFWGPMIVGFQERFADEFTELQQHSAVECTFKSRGGLATVNPINTNSQNLDVFSTSSIPYFDGRSFDRGGVIQPDLEGDVTINI